MRLRLVACGGKTYTSINTVDKVDVFLAKWKTVNITVECSVYPNVFITVNRKGVKNRT